jgi:regulator of sigma E protease
VTVAVDRTGGQREFSVPVDTVEENGAVFGRIGIEPETELIERLRERVVSERHYGPIESLRVAVGETWAMTGLTLRMLGRMISGEVSLKNMSGPLMIANYAGDYVRAGFDDFLRFLSLISISLGIMNLVPVPILDGGQIVMCLVEAIKGSPVSMRTAMIGQQVGLAMLIALMGFVFYIDITRMMGL